MEEKRRHRSYTIKQKRDAALRLEGGQSLASLSRELSVSRSCLRLWLSQYRNGDLAGLANSMKRVKGGGRKPLSSELDGRLKAWYDECRARKEVQPLTQFLFTCYS